MPSFKIAKGNSVNLPTNKTDGCVYYTTDKNKFYIDTYVTESIVSDGSSSYVLSRSFENIRSVVVGEDTVDDYTYDSTTRTITFTTAPESDATIIVTDNSLSRSCINSPSGSVGVDVTNENAKFSIIESSGSGSGSGTTQIYRGNTEPTNSDILIWMDTSDDEEILETWEELQTHTWEYLATKTWSELGA